jgi:hypothetical protein
MFEGGLYLYPAGAKAALLRTFKRHHRQRVRPAPDTDLDVFFSRHGSCSTTRGSTSSCRNRCRAS